ncbi:DNA internalization-related competence protein ComEC/Rec2 [Pseudoduganella sp. DS3]|uniref:DNA internalization-related competence protein ComEC/Rec2 n=1 Tax=Pseudoduganella guangdongensis TaxID=2692179 RepID=A0A6N9HJH0_9BURK|nr:DNA internalization-related competence protein ComEC/Rec2 [Pseudoduganella guangdongensis]MYN03771.1 DNA internalization-related competence protein ComEC/Rec2 [Pseudoduganella guangdongensis]
MRCAILGLVGGAAWLHRQASLPDGEALLACVLGALFSVLAGALLRRRGGARMPGAILVLLRAALAGLAGALLGFAWSAHVAQGALAQDLAKADEGRDIDIVGTIDSLPSRQEGSTRFNFAVESPAAVPPRIVLSWYAGRTGALSPPPQLLPGERWRLKVRLQRPHGNANPHGFDYELWLLEQGIRATGYVRPEGPNERLSAFAPSAHNAVERARFAIREHIADALQERRYAGVIAALAMGDQRGISQQDWQVFSRTGIAHLVSISGLHITMIAGLVAWLAGWLWRKSFFMPAWQLPLRLPAPRVAVLAGLLAAWMYVALAGFGVPAQRTLYMLAVVAAAMWLDRLAAISHVLALAAGVVVLLDPWAVMWPGFWLSFGAVAVILYATVGRMGHVRVPKGASRAAPEPHPARAWRARQLANLRLAAVTQFAVTAGLVPLTILLFSQVSIVSPLANAIAIPVISLLVTPLALLGSVLPAVLAGPVLRCAHWILELLLDMLQWLSAQPLAVWSAPAPDWPTFAFALAGTVWMLAPRGWPMRWLGLACWLPLLAASPVSPPPGTARVIAFDVGQGMALLVETATHRLLYDSGPTYTPEANGGNRVVLPYLRARGITALDVMVVSHSDSDHSGGALAVLRDTRTAKLMSSLPPGHPITEAAVRHQQCIAGQAWEWDGVQFEMLHPTLASHDDPALKPNARGCTLRITAAGRSILLPADIEAAQEAQLLAAVPEKLPAEILLVPHHGSGTSSTPGFLNAVQPRHAIFQLGYRNRYRHPRADVLERYRAMGAGIWRTDEAGAVSLEIGPGVTLEAYRQQHPRYWYGR